MFITKWLRNEVARAVAAASAEERAVYWHNEAIYWRNLYRALLESRQPQPLPNGEIPQPLTVAEADAKEATRLRMKTEAL